jgi:hypothetical protein
VIRLQPSLTSKLFARPSVRHHHYRDARKDQAQDGRPRPAPRARPQDDRLARAQLAACLGELVRGRGGFTGPGMARNPAIAPPSTMSAATSSATAPIRSSESSAETSTTPKTTVANVPHTASTQHTTRPRIRNALRTIVSYALRRIARGPRTVTSITPGTT